MTLIEIGKLLKQAREQEELTQEQLAKELVVDPTTISLAENGSLRTGKVFINILAKRLGVTFDLTFPYDQDDINLKRTEI